MSQSDRSKAQWVSQIDTKSYMDSDSDCSLYELYILTETLCLTKMFPYWFSFSTSVCSLYEIYILTETLKLLRHTHHGMKQNRRKTRNKCWVYSHLSFNLQQWNLLLVRMPYTINSSFFLWLHPALNSLWVKWVDQNPISTVNPFAGLQSLWDMYTYWTTVFSISVWLFFRYTASCFVEKLIETLGRTFTEWYV